MARMVATKAALSIRVDALTDTNGKSEPQAPSIGLDNRAKLEARLHALEQQGDGSAVRSAFAGKKQGRFEMTGETRTYNTAADAVDLVPTQREPVEAAVKAVLDVKAEKKKAKEERKARKRAEKEEIADGIEEARMDVDGEEESKESKKEKKRKRRESEAMEVDQENQVCPVVDGILPPPVYSLPTFRKPRRQRNVRRGRRRARRRRRRPRQQQRAMGMGMRRRKRRKRSRKHNN